MSQAGILTVANSPPPPQVPTEFITDSGTGIPILNQLELLASTVLAGTNPITTTGSGNTVTIEAQLSQALAAPDITKVGLANFDSAAFSVDADGFVSLVGGGGTVTSFSPNSGTDPVVADGAGLVNLKGSGNITTVGSLNTITTSLTGILNHSVQVGSSTNTLTQIAVGTDGQVLIGGTASDPAFASLTSTGATILFTAGVNSLNLETSTAVATSYTTDSGSAVPAAGVLTVAGASVAAGTSPVATSGAGSTVTINVQTSQAIASTDATKIGLCNFDSSQFSVDANGFVTSIEAPAELDYKLSFMFGGM